MDAEALQALLQADPKSFDMGMLKPMRKEMEAAQAAAAQAGDDAAGESLAMLQQAIDTMEREQVARLNTYATGAMEDFEKAVAAKRNVENRWCDDAQVYDGDERLKDSKAYSNDAGDRNDSQNERPAYRAVRSRTLRYAARLGDMLLPGNDIPMKVEPSPKPDPDSFPGLQITQDLTPSAVLDYATDAASRMQNTIKDQLFEQKFTEYGHKSIFDGTKWGTGLVKGPMMDYRKRRKPVGQQSEIILDESPTPGCRYVDPWMFYDDMSPTLEECSRCWEVHLMDRRKLNDLKRYPNVIEKNIDDLLEEDDPTLPPQLSVNITTRNQKMDAIEPIKDRWAVIEMHGLMDVEDVEKILGIPWTDKKSLPLVEFWFCNGKAIKCKLGPMECDWRVPYYNFTPFPCDDTIWGYGVPRMGRGGAKIIRGALDATMRNASVASGPLIAFRKGEVTPQSGEWRLVGPIVLEVQTDSDIKDAIYAQNIPANIEGNLELLQKGLDFLDDDILFDQIINGDVSDEEVPAAGLLQIINLRTIFQRWIATGADNTWFKPQGDRWCQWNIQYNPDQSIKGDFDVKGIAASTLVAKDLQMQHLNVFIQTSGLPQFAGFTNNYEVFASFARMLDVPNRDKLVFDQQQAEKNQQQMQQNGGDPMVAVKMQELQLKEKQMTAELQLKQQEMTLAHEERMAEIQRQTNNDQTNAQVQILVAQSKKDVAMLSLAQEQKLQIWQIAAAMKKAGLDNDTKKVLAMMDAHSQALGQANDNVRTAATLGVQAATEGAHIQKEHLHKAADIAHERNMTQMQQQHEKSMPKPVAANE